MKAEKLEIFAYILILKRFHLLSDTDYFPLEIIAKMKNYMI